MFAVRNQSSATKSAESESERATAPGSKESPEPNPIWQSLAQGSSAIQTKLAVSQPGDPLEREADQIAARVMRMTGPRSSEAKLSLATFPLVKAQRKCDQGDGEEEEKLQRKAQSPNPDSSLSAPSIVQAALNSPGQSLDPITRSFMEERFDHDFGHVRVHTDTKAAESATAINARAYTAGRDVVLGPEQYSPGTERGRHLLAHELAHVVQQGKGNEQAAGTLIQRDTRDSIPLYEPQIVGGSVQQVRTTRTDRGFAMPVSYDPATSVFAVTFQLVWIFPHGWTNPRRYAYVQSFKASVRRVWNDRFLLNETRPPRRTAHVEIGLDSIVIPQMANESLEIVQLDEPPARGRWRMDIRHGGIGFRENVDRHGAVGAGAVHLQDTSMDPRRHTPAGLREGRQFSVRNPRERRTYTQATAPHEFGHMIGLGDEYLEDSGVPIPSAVRGQINARIMNVGEEVTADAYAPFAAWLSDLTSTTWRVGRRVR